MLLSIVSNLAFEVIVIIWACCFFPVKARILLYFAVTWGRSGVRKRSDRQIGDMARKCREDYAREHPLAAAFYLATSELDKTKKLE